MEMRKQGNEGQATARSASKSSPKKQSGEQAGAGGQGASPNQQANQGTAAQSAPANPGAAPQSAPANQSMSQDQKTSGQQPENQDLLQHAKHASGEIVNQVQQRAGSQFNRQKESAASELSQVANAVRRIRENLGGEESGTLTRYAAEYTDKAANSIERLSTYIREQDPKQLLDDVQNFGRRRPALLLGGAFLLGFAGARLIKSSMDAVSQQHSYRPNVQTPNVPATRPSTATNTL